MALWRLAFIPLPRLYLLVADHVWMDFSVYSFYSSPLELRLLGYIFSWLFHYINYLNLDIVFLYKFIDILYIVERFEFTVDFIILLLNLSCEQIVAIISLRIIQCCMSFRITDTTNDNNGSSHRQLKLIGHERATCEILLFPILHCDPLQSVSAVHLPDRGVYVYDLESCLCNREPSAHSAG